MAKDGKHRGPWKTKVSLPADFSRVEELAAAGYRERDIARELNMTETSWREQKITNDRLIDALEKGLSRHHNPIVQSMTEMATLWDREKGPSMANVRAAEFLLESKHGYRRDAPNNKATGVHIQFMLPQALDPKDYAKVIDAVKIEKKRKKNPLLAAEAESDADAE